MINKNDKIGVLLLNLGTPNSPLKQDVAKYLRQFLSDKRVINLPIALRWVLVNFIIVPFRAKKSAAAYAGIWQDNGSPLLINSLLLTQKLSDYLGANYTVVLGMSYGEPDIKASLLELQNNNIKKIIVLPLFPQYSSSATGSPLETVLKNISKYPVIPDVQIKTAYYNNPHFIQALAMSIKPYLNSDYDYILMSYHGLPERQSDAHRYREQCFITAKLVTDSLNLSANKWSVSFQSRLGKLPWIKPYTDQTLVELYNRGIRNLIICCPSFVADCLETLEEIGIQANQQWLDLGGNKLTLVPCLNAQDFWVKNLAAIILD